MKKILVGAFSSYLNFKYNPSEKFLENLPEKDNLIKHLFPVTYFKSVFINPIKKQGPDKIIILAYDEAIVKPKFETYAKNEMITLKNPFLRSLVLLYSYFLNLLGKNFQVKGEISKDKLEVIPISKKAPKRLKMAIDKPKFSHVDISNDAGYFVCNYAIWVIENYIKKSNKNIEFAFIHLPLKYSKAQEKEITDYILKDFKK